MHIKVEYLDFHNMLVKELTTKESITIHNLRPHRNYTFTVKVRSGDNGSELRVSVPLSASFSTRESVPERVPTFSPTDIQPSQVTFEWTLPSQDQNGVLVGFTVSYGILVKDVPFFVNYYWENVKIVFLAVVGIDVDDHARLPRRKHAGNGERLVPGQDVPVPHSGQDQDRIR